MNSDLMFSSKTDMWATPQEFFDSLDKVFRFETDVCAVKDNAKCQRFYTPDDNGLLQDWRGGLAGVMITRRGSLRVPVPAFVPLQRHRGGLYPAHSLAPVLLGSLPTLATHVPHVRILVLAPRSRSNAPAFVV